MNMCLVGEMKQTFYKHKNILYRLLSQLVYQDILFYRDTQLKSNTSPKKTSFMQTTHVQCCHNYLKSICF